MITLKTVSMKKVLWFILLCTGLLSCSDTNTITQEIEVTLTPEQMDSVAMIECDAMIRRFRTQKIDTIGTPSYMPETLEACFEQLDTLLNDSLKEWARCLPDGAFGGGMHHSFGMYLRNNWRLWGETKLVKHFREMGVFHPDDMSSIILDSYQRRLKGEQIKLEEQIKYYQDYWETGGFSGNHDTLQPKDENTDHWFIDTFKSIRIMKSE